MKKTLLFTMLSIISFGIFAQGTLEGNLRDTEGEPLSYATVTVLQNGKIISSVSTDFDGHYLIRNLNEGDYEVTVNYQMKTSDPKIVKISDRETYAFSLAFDAVNEVGPAVVKVYKSLFNREEPTTIEIKGIVFQETGAKDVKKLLELEGSTTKNKDGKISFRGSRPGTALYIIDGVPVNGVLDIPTSAIYSMKVYNGGVPARFGNTTGAVINIRTKSYFDNFN